MNAYREEIVDYLVGRLSTKHSAGMLTHTKKVTLDGAPILGWWIFEGKEYHGYKGGMSTNWTLMEEQIRRLLATFNPNWQGSQIPEGEIDWVATAFRSSTSVAPEFVCKSSQVGLSVAEKKALTNWISWIREIWNSYNDCLGLTQSHIFVDLAPEIRRGNFTLWELRKSAATAKRSRWSFLRNVVAESLRCAFEEIDVDRLPLPDDPPSLFELLCMVRVLSSIDPNPKHIQWVDKRLDTNTCKIPSATYYYQQSFSREDILNTSAFSTALSAGIKRQSLSLPKYADGYLQFEEPVNGFNGILIEAKSGENRNFSETIYQLSGYLGALKKQDAGRLLVWGIVEESKDAVAESLLQAKWTNTGDDVWFFSSASEISDVLYAFGIGNGEAR